MKVISKSFKTIVLAAASVAALGLTATSCVNDDLQSCPVDGGMGKTVRFRIEKPASTRTDEATANGGTLQLNGGHLFFVNAQNQITKVVRIVDASTPSSGDSIASITDLSSTVGHPITSVPASSITAYVVANQPAGKLEPKLNGFLSQVMDSVIMLKEQGAVANQLLTGNGAVNPPAAGSNNYTATITAAPLTARLEIDKITAVNPAGAAVKILSYRIDGIFVDNIYEEMNLNDSSYVAPKEYITPASGADNTTMPAHYDKVAFDYVTAADTTLGKAMQIISNGDTLRYTPKQDVWGYNQLAPKADIAGPVASTPNIYIRVSNIKTDNPNSVYTGEYYLTIKTLTDGGTPITALKQGMIYEISDIQFQLQNLQQKPGQGPIDVDVTVKLAQWGNTDTGVILN
ncbi:MAG: hypothetical protein LBH04_00555 [Tannerellaceae bacterium]|jgi:hypothetical protein|nr:hypothetical protein [Tannerellaceae bacterium]